MTELRDLVTEELSLAVDPRVGAMAAAIAAEHGEASRAVLFYGSCLRQRQLDGLMLDFYLIVSDYRAAYAKSWLAAANRLIPPNVFYFEHDGLASKYAVLSEADFERECGAQAQSTSVLARFAQPSRLAWVSNNAAAAGAISSIAKCAPTLLARTAALVPAETAAAELWTHALQLTFAAEIRAERSDRSASIVEADPQRYEQFGRAALATVEQLDERAARRWWKRMQRKGKMLSVARLAKASATFAGGADYVAWKINRHSGAGIELKPWQRRHPLLAAITLLPRLLKSGAVR